MPHLKWLEAGMLGIVVPGTEMFIDSGIVRRNWDEPLSLVEKQIAAAPEMYALLKEIEWAGNKVDSNLVDHCPCCGCVRPDGHATSCRLAAVLKAVEGEENADTA